MISMKCQNNDPSPIKFTDAVLWVGLAQLIIYIISFFTFPVISKTFGPALYGLWAQIIVTVGLLTPIITFHLGTAMVRYLSNEKSLNKLSQSFSNMFYLILLVSIILIALSFVFRYEIAQFIFANQEFSSYIILTFIWASSSAFLLYLISFLRAQGRIKELSLINIFCYFAKFIPLVCLAYLGFSLSFIIISQIFIEIIFVFYLTINIIKRIGYKTPNCSNLKKYLKFSIPQIPTGALLWILDASDRYFITNILNLTQTGIYSASYTLGTTISAFYIPISFVVFPVISKFWENGNIKDVKRYLEYSTKLFLTLAIPSVVGLYIISKPLLILLSSADFVSGGGLLTLLIAVGTIFLGLYQINLYVICLVEKTHTMPLIVFLGAIINIILNIVLIPQMGIMGAAIATICAYALLALIVLVWAKKEIGYSINGVFLLKIILSTVVMYLLLQIFQVNTILDIVFIIILGLFVYSVCVVLFRAFSEEEEKFILSFLKSFKSKISI
ncbi:MAG: Polysaccharide biosynthesis protein [Methanobacterium sp. 42_16]|nr:MAG: Polysaccharide biosynthesis protein [Methanobacterium sp. 42_16]